MNASDLTIFLISCGQNPNRDDALAALRAQTAVQNGAVIVEIRNVAPMSRAFQAMIDKCETRFYLQCDEDMILEADAAQGMLGFLGTRPEKTAFAVFMLHDVHLDMDIQGVKIYDHEIMRQYPYNLDTISCEKEQLDRLRAAGYAVAESRIVMGEHSPKWSPELIFERYFDLMEKWKVYGYYWLEDLPRKLLDKFGSQADETNLYAFLGTWASASQLGALRTREKDFRIRTPEFLRARSYFSRPTQATLYITGRCNMKCGFCLRQGDMAKVSPAPDFSPDIVDTLMARFPSIKAVCLCGFGEPLLHPRLSAIIDRCNSYGLWVGLITNGTLLADAMPTLVRHRPSCISVSLNAASRDEHLWETGAVGAWDKIMAGIAAVGGYQKCLCELGSTDRGIPLYLSRVCTAQNLDGIPAFLKLAQDLPATVTAIDLHNVLPHNVGTPERDEAFLATVLTGDHWEAIQAMKKLPGAELVRSWPVPITPDAPQRACEYPFSSIAVDGNKSISLCNSVMPPSPENGNIEDVKVWHSPYAERMRAMFGDTELPAYCRWCFRNWC